MATLSLTPQASAPGAPLIAQYSSRSDVSPEMPIAPMVKPSASSISTPPGTGIVRPSDAVASVV